MFVCFTTETKRIPHQMTTSGLHVEDNLPSLHHHESADGIQRVSVKVENLDQPQYLFSNASITDHRMDERYDLENELDREVQDPRQAESHDQMKHGQVSKANSLSNLLTPYGPVKTNGQSHSASPNSLNPFKLLPPLTPNGQLSVSGDDHLYPPGSAMSTLSGFSGISLFHGISPNGSNFVSPRHSARSGNRGNISQARKRTLSVSPLSIDGLDLTALIRGSPNALFLASRGSSRGVSPLFGSNINIAGAAGLGVSPGTYGHLSARKSISPSSNGSYSRQLLLATPASMILPYTSNHSQHSGMNVSSTDEYLAGAYTNVLDNMEERRLSHGLSNQLAGYESGIPASYQRTGGNHGRSMSGQSQLIVSTHSDNMAQEHRRGMNEGCNMGISSSTMTMYPVDKQQAQSFSVKSEYMPSSDIGFSQHQTLTNTSSPYLTAPPPPYTNTHPSHLSARTILPQYSSPKHASLAYQQSIGNMNTFRNANAHYRPLNNVHYGTNVATSTTSEQRLLGHVNIPGHFHLPAKVEDGNDNSKNLANPLQGGRWICRWIDCNHLFKVYVNQ